MELTEAAVLVPIVIKKGAEPRVLYTVRSESVSKHKGEVCFPGGRLEKNDQSLANAAIREAEEEIGIPSNKIEIRHKLSGCSTLSGYRITPIVGVIQDDFDIQMCPREVSEVFYMPISNLIKLSSSYKNFSNISDHMYQSLGEIREHGPEIQFNSYTIWGATAVISLQLIKSLEKESFLDNINSLSYT